MNTNERLSIRMVIGIEANLISNDNLTILGKEIGLVVSQISGGCIVNYSSGFWDDDGDAFLDEYHSLKLQKNIDINVSILAKDKNRFKNFIEKKLSELDVLKKYNVQHIHFEESLVKIGHFSICKN